MKTNRKNILSGLMALSLVFNPLGAGAEDIDIFVGSTGSAGNPNVLIVLDNTSNWARMSQQWPGGIQQGQAEVRSIKTVMDAIGSDINVGVMEFVTNGNANDNGGFIRFPILPMTAGNKTALKAEMDEIFGDINGNLEKRNANEEYGNLKQDVFNYFAGSDASSNGSNTTRSLSPPSDRVHDGGYDATYSNFKTPLSKDGSCAKNYVIFIGNPNSSGPADDDASNTTELGNRTCNTTNIGLPNFDMISTPTTSNLGNTGTCYADQGACTTAVTAGSEAGLVACTNGSYESCACGATVAAVPSCGAGTQRYSVLGTDAAGTDNLGYASNCASNAGQCDTSTFAAQCNGVGVTCACSNAALYQTPNTCAPTSKKKYMVIRTKANTSVTNLGYTTACYANQGVCSTAEYAATCTTLAGYAAGSGCACGNPTITETSCPAGTSQYVVSGTNTEIIATPTGTFDTTGKGSSWNLDEWSRCLYQKGVPVAGGDNQNAAVYTIDVYNKQQNPDHTALLMSAARVGGGKYFAATNEDALVNALKQIFAEIQSVNSTFASASLPVSATNRTQNENQVFIGMFRPDPQQRPRWFGNLKRYQIILQGDGVTLGLGDKNGNDAINTQTGFIGDCAVSYWTTDSKLASEPGYYWEYASVSPDPSSKCPTIASDEARYSDSPDGPTVEKGAVAEVMRKGNWPPVSDSSPWWWPSRVLYTTTSESSTALDWFWSSPGVNNDQKTWTYGLDTQFEDAAWSTWVRPSLHGDVVHSRPLPVNYGSNTIIVYYGSNDGMFRAVDADTGRERWAFWPYEFAQEEFADRLRLNVPIIKYPETDMTIVPTPKSKTYGWDGSVGFTQNLDNTKIWLYPTMRRGGSSVYAINVTNPNVPSLMWKKSSSVGAGFENMGQSWSTPVVVEVAGYTDEDVAIFGGGYDTCEDEDSSSPACGGSPKGANVYVVNAKTGELLAKFDTERSVTADVSLVDLDGDGKVDYGYVVDTGGNVYRIDMVKRELSGDPSAIVYTAKSPGSWSFRKIASAGNGRKFLFAPALFPLSKDGRVYVAVGSGDREHPLHTNYPYKDPVTNRFYVYLDDLMEDSGSIDLNSLDDKTLDLGCNAVSIFASSVSTGWYIDLKDSGKVGEQTVTSALILAGKVFFSTNRPIPPADGTCSNVLGGAQSYSLNLFNASGTLGAEKYKNCGGDRSDDVVGGGMPPSPVDFTVNIEGKQVTGCFGCPNDDGPTVSVAPGKIPVPVRATRSRLYYKIKGVD